MDAALTIQHNATRADLEALPAHLRGELIDGVLYAMTRPRARHQAVAGAIADDLFGPYHRGRGGPGGWWILPEPGIELPGAPEVAPDLAGWRRTRLASLPTDRAINLVPDWVCEVLSPTTRRHNQLVKKPYYARVGVPWLWLVDAEALALTVLRLEAGRWVEIGAYGDVRDVRVEPFDATPLDVLGWWEALDAVP